jgi:LytS/YehU family sensor histidine kinase
LNRYIELENLRRKNKVVSTITVDKAIDTCEIEIPPMLIEPLIENVFVHAFDNSIKECKLAITFSMKNDKLLCKVEDNGKGYTPNERNSKGLKLVQERVQLFKRESQNSFNIKKLENGTLAEIEISIR